MNNEVNITKLRIAVVEDEEDLRLSLRDYLFSSGYSVWAVDSAEAFYKQLLIKPVDMVILDIGLPGESGLQVAHHLSNLGGIEIIILSGRSAVEDRVEGLNQGAGRYLVKPIDMCELVANIQSAARTRQSLTAIGKNTNEAGWTLLCTDWILKAPDETPITLTTREFAFLDCLLKGNRQAASRAELAIALTNGKLDGFDYHRIDMVATRLRQKIAAATHIIAPIKTEQGIGFVFTAKCQVR